MKPLLSRIVRWLTFPPALAGAMLGATLAGVSPGGTGLPGLVAGWLYGIVVSALVRLFRVPPPAYPLAGLVAGPVPLALLMPTDAPEADRAVIWIGLFAGLVIGCVEWAHAVHRRRQTEGRAAGIGLDPG